ncbi:cyclase family protein [Yinghuangia seranimata]|uniref:cyclase family protein n=1 Tax=Yinghuangia seranimata TaxID=408067 RepID=UPI00248AC19F|nr:cyclase family protein [Yinghuangia seranimata]MDI2130332.1 cyclase family protein [Yinghuangia seranimata]
MPMPAEFTELAKRVNNWGRWGKDDQIGTMNLVTDDVVKAAAACVKTGKRFSLAVELREDGIQNGMIPGRDNPKLTTFLVNHEVFGPGTVATSDDAVTMGIQAGTHWDGFTHATYEDRLYNGFSAKETVTAENGAVNLGIERIKTLVTRGVLLDVAGAKGVERLEPMYAVTPEDLEAAEEFGNVKVRAGDIVLVRTGQITVYFGGDRDNYFFSPGLSVRCPEWFHARDVAAVANDTVTFEVFPPEIEDCFMAVHALHLVEMGMLQGQNWNLEELAADCKADGVYEFLLDASPQPFVGGVGSPVNPIAIK